MKSWKVTLPNMLMLVFVVCVLMSNLVPVRGIVGSAFISFCGCICYLYVLYKRREDPKLWKITGFAVFLSLCMFVSSVYNHNAGLKEILWIWCYMGAALLLSSFEIDDRWMQLLFYLLSAYFVICIIMHRSVHYILYSTSRNGISSHMLFVMLLIYLCRGTKKRVIYLPAVLNVIICVWALGRAGVLAAVFFLIGIVTYGLVKDGWKSAWKRLAGVAAVLMVSVVLLMTVFPTNETLRPEENKTGQTESVNDPAKQPAVLDKDFSTEKVTQKEKTFLAVVSGSGLRSRRISVWKEYLSRAAGSASEFLLGVDCSKGELLAYYTQPHNSYLELHAKFGLAGFVSVMALLFMSCIRFLRNRKWLWLLIMAACGLRSFLDWTAFPGAYDVFFWYFIFNGMFAMRIDNEKVQCHT